MRLTSIMGSFAQSPEYIGLFTADQSELMEIIIEIGAEVADNLPSKAVIINVPDAAVNAAISEFAGELNLPDDAYEIAVTRMLAGVPAILNSHQGVNVLAATSILSASKALMSHEDFAGSAYIILVYNNFNSVTFFRKHSEGVVSASSTFVFLDGDMLDAITERTVLDYISEVLGISGVTVEYLYGDTLVNYRY